MVEMSKFSKETAYGAHGNTILCSKVLPAGVTETPFDHAWGYLDHPGEMEAHRHHTEEIYFFFKGHGYVTVDGERAEVQNGDVVRIPPDALHTVGNESNDELLWAAFWWPVP